MQMKVNLAFLKKIQSIIKKGLHATCPRRGVINFGDTTTQLTQTLRAIPLMEPQTSLHELFLIALKRLLILYPPASRRMLYMQSMLPSGMKYPSTSMMV